MNLLVWTPDESLLSFQCFDFTPGLDVSALTDNYSLLMLEAWHSLPPTSLKDDGRGKTGIIC
jgi:hypothetical protein